MALGYTIASILKRSSHVFCDERVCVKIDWLEQLNRHYLQVVHLSLYEIPFLSSISFYFWYLKLLWSTCQTKVHKVLYVYIVTLGRLSLFDDLLACFFLVLT